MKESYSVAQKVPRTKAKRLSRELGSVFVSLQTAH